MKQCEVACLFEATSRELIKKMEYGQAEDLCNKAIELCQQCEYFIHCMIPKLCQKAVIHLSQKQYDQVEGVLDEIQKHLDFHHEKTC